LIDNKDHKKAVLARAEQIKRQRLEEEAGTPGKNFSGLKFRQKFFPAF